MPFAALPSTGTLPRGEQVARGSLIGFTIAIPVVSWALDVGVALTASHLVAFVLIALAAALWVTTRRPIALDLATISLTCFVAVAAVSVARVLLRDDLVILGESMHRKAVKQFVGLGFAYAVFVALRYLLQAYRLVATVARAHVWTTAAVAALALLQFGVALWDIESAWANFPVYNSTLGETRGLGTGVVLYGFPRVSLTLVEPSRLGIYLLSGWALWLYTVGSPRRGRGYRLLGTVAGIMVGAAVLITGSRVAHIVFVMCAMGAVAFRPPRLYRLGLAVASIAVAASLTSPWKAAGVTATLIPEDVPVAVMPAPAGEHTAGVLTRRPRNTAGRIQAPPGAERLLDSVQRKLLDVGRRSNVSAKHRIGSLFVALAVLRAQPLLGTGYGTSEFAMATEYPKDMGQIVAEGQYRPTMLGIHAVVLTETGIAGAVCILALTVGIGLAIYRAIRNGAPEVRALAWGIAAAIGAYGMAMSVQPLEVYQFLLLWVLLALAVSLEVRDGRPPANPMVAHERTSPRSGASGPTADR